MTRCFKSNYVIFLSVIVFIGTLIAKIQFYNIIILLLEFIVIVEIFKMIDDFIQKRKLRLRYVIDVFIIFLIRDIIIKISQPTIEHYDVVFITGITFVLFIFRYMAIKFSPSIHKSKTFKRAVSKQQR